MHVLLHRWLVLEYCYNTCRIFFPEVLVALRDAIATTIVSCFKFYPSFNVLEILKLVLVYLLVYL